jgi:ABC-type nitrate/sulfonate/bicarbonate transport system permease component
MMARGRSLQVALGAAPILLIALLWQAITASGYAPASLLPPPSDVIVRLGRQLSSSEFLSHIGSTLWRLFAGFSIAAAIGIFLGLWAAVNRTASAIVRPLVRLLAPIPKIALYPAFLLVLGFDHASKITLVAADALFPILLSTFYGAAMVDHKLVWSALAAGTPVRLIPFKVVVPAAMPSILTGCRIGLVISCIVVFLAEMISSTDGLGYLLVRATRSFQTVDMFVPLVTISLLGLLLNGLLYQARRYFLRGFPEV